MKDVDVSVVIPTKNAESTLRQVLQGILDQETEQEYEVILIDSGSSDGTCRIARSFDDSRFRLLYVDPKEFNHGATRNTAVSQARGNFIVFLVQDAIPMGRTWLRNLVEPFKDSSIAGVFCRQVPRQDASIMVRTECERWLAASLESLVKEIQSEEDFNALLPWERYCLCYFDNVCSCVRRSVWERFPFQNVPFAEDIVWSKEVMLKGHRIYYQADAAVIHSHDRSAWYDYKRGFMDHYMCYVLFGMESTPTFKVAIRQYFTAFKGHLRDIRQAKAPGCQKFFQYAYVPMRTLAKILCRYDGVRYAKKGKELPGWIKK